MAAVSPRHGAAAASTADRVKAPLLAVVVVLFLCGAVQQAEARLERQTYAAYRTPHLCSLQMMESVGCAGETPMCCVASSAIRCCAGTTSCGNCTEEVVGYEMPRTSVFLGCFSLSVLVLLGSIIMSGVGRHLAWVLERRRVIEAYRTRLLLRRAEAREFKQELTATEEKDIEDAVACVICCARHIDVALTPCGHVCCCRFCAKRLRECPVCRSAVLRCFDLPLYYVKQLVSAAAAGDDRDGAVVPTTATSTTTTTAAPGEAAAASAPQPPATHEDGVRSAGEGGEEMDEVAAASASGSAADTATPAASCAEGAVRVVTDALETSGSAAAGAERHRGSKAAPLFHPFRNLHRARLRSGGAVEAEAGAAEEEEEEEACRATGCVSSPLLRHDASTSGSLSAAGAPRGPPPAAVAAAAAMGAPDDVDDEAAAEALVVGDTIVAHHPHGYISVDR